MNIDEVLDAMDEMLDKSWNLPLSGGRCVVDADRVRDLIDDIRINLPTELKQAKDVVSERNNMLATAKKESDIIIRKAEERARILLAQEEIVKQAQHKAEEMLTQAQLQAREVKQGTYNFSDCTLRQAEEALTSALGELRTARQTLRNNFTKK